MSKDKQTYVDPDTGEEIESTGLARGCGGVIAGVLVGVMGGWVMGVVSGLDMARTMSPMFGPQFGLMAGLRVCLGMGVIAGLLGGLLFGLGGSIGLWRRDEKKNVWSEMGKFGGIFGLIFGFICAISATAGQGFSGLVYGLMYGLGIGGVGGFIYSGFCRWDVPVHDRIARTQHRRRQRVIRSQDDQNVPDTAISRAQPPGEPQPTDAALSIAGSTEGTRLTVEIEEHTEDQVPVSQ